MVILANLVVAEPTFSAPQLLVLNEPFNMSVSLDSAETFDIKLYVQSINQTLLSQTYNEGWKSSFYYLIAVFPSQQTFSLRVVKASNEAELCLRVRKTSSKAVSPPVCQSVKIGSVGEETLIQPDIPSETQVLHLANPTLTTFNSKSTLISKGVVYTFILFCSLILILMLRRKL